MGCCWEGSRGLRWAALGSRRAPHLHSQRSPSDPPGLVAYLLLRAHILEGEETPVWEERWANGGCSLRSCVGTPAS